MMKKELKEKLTACAIPLALGGLSALITKDGMETFQTIKQPPLSPPGWLFPVAWTILYILMGLASYYVWSSKAHETRKVRALSFYTLQLILNFFWSILFFSMGLYLFSFIWLLVLWAVIIVTAVLFRFISDRAGKLMIPYILWVTFAAYLNLGVYLLN